MQVPAGRTLVLPFSFVDASGNAAKVDGTPDVAATAGTTSIASDGAGGFVAKWTADGHVGTFTISGTADVDLGEGKKELTFSLGDHEALASPEATNVKVGDATIE